MSEIINEYNFHNKTITDRTTDRNKEQTGKIDPVTNTNTTKNENNINNEISKNQEIDKKIQVNKVDNDDKNGDEELDKLIKMTSEGDLEIELSTGKISVMRRSKAIKYYKLSKHIAELFSKDTSTKVGALFIYPDTMQILSMGYNGMPRGVDEKDSSRWTRPNKYKFVEHAERNAMYNSAQSGTSLRDAICVSSLFPCADCARGIIQSGCKMVISLHFADSVDEKDPDRIKRWHPDWKVSLEMLKESGIKIMLLRNNELQ